MATIAQLWVDLNLRSNDFNNQIRAAQREAKEFQKTLAPTTKLLNDIGDAATGAGKALSISLTAPIVGFGALAVKQFTEAADAAALLENAVRSTGGAAGRTADQLKQVASELQKNTIFSDDEIIRKVSTQLLTFTNIAGTSFDRATKAALDMSTVLGQDLQSSAIQLGKALNDPVRGVTALQRVGVKLSESQKELVKSFMATGDIAKAQDVILKELTTEFGGAAEAAAKAGSGPFTVLKNKIEDLTESWGELIVKALLPFVNTASRIADWLGTLSTETKTLVLVIASIAAAAGPVLLVFGQFAKAISSILVFMPQLKVAFTAVSAVLSGPAGIAAAAVAAAAGLIYLISKTEAGAQAISDIWETIKQTASDIWMDLQSTLHDIADTFSDAASDIKDLWDEWGGDIVAGTKNAIKLLAAAVEFALRELAGLVRAGLGVISGGIDLVMGIITGNWDRAWKGLTKLATTAWNGIVDTVMAGAKLLERVSRAVGSTEIADAIAAVTGRISEYRVQAESASTATKATETAAKSYGLVLPEVTRKVFDLGGATKTLTENTHAQTQAWIKQRAEMYEVELAIRRMNEAFDRPAPPIFSPLPGSIPILNPGQVPQLPTLPRTGIPPVFGPAPQASTEIWDKWRREGQKAIDSVVDDISKMFVEGIIHGKSFWQSFKNLGQNAVTGIVDTLLNKMLHSFLDPFATAIGRVLDKLTSGLTDILADWGKSLAEKIGTSVKDAATNAAAKAATGGIGGGGGTGGGESGGAEGAGAAGGIIQMAVQAAGSIGVIFQLKRIEGTMNAVEANTRFAYIHLGVMINQLFWPWDGLFHFMADQIHEQVTQLDAIYNVLNSRLSAGSMNARVAYAAAGPEMSAASSNVTINIPVMTSGDPVDFARRVREILKSSLKTDRDGVRTDVMLAASQNRGLASSYPSQ